jgi:hypothetical protein
LKDNYRRLNLEFGAPNLASDRAHKVEHCIAVCARRPACRYYVFKLGFCHYKGIGFRNFPHLPCPNTPNYACGTVEG